VDATALIRSMFQAQGGLPAPGMGTLPEAWLDATLLQRTLRRVCQTPQAWLRYGDPAGNVPLRQALVPRLADLGVHATAAQIVTTVGATHALDLVSRTLLQPGDAVLVDDPGWAVEYARLTRLGMRLLPVPRGEQGPDLAVMEALLRQVIAQNPSYYNAYNALGFTLADRNMRLPEAKQLIIKALTFAPNDPFITDSLGWVEFRLGNLGAALSYLQKAYKDRADAEIAAHLGEVLWMMKREDEAIKVWREGLNLAPSNETLQETLQRLKPAL
jgi:hypothetical protein